MNYYIDGSDKFRNFPCGTSPNHLSGKAVRHIIGAPNGGVYVATEDGGINYIDSKNRITRTEQLNPAIHSNIHSLLLTKSGKLFLGAFQRVLTVLDTHSGELRPIKGDNTQVRSIFTMAEDDLGVIWAGGPLGLFKITPNGAGGLAQRILTESIFWLDYRGENTLWLGTRHRGVHSLNTQTNQMEMISEELSQKYHITHIASDSKGRTWVGTNNNGVLLLNAQNQIERVIGEEILGTNCIRSIIEDDYGDIWIGTSNGLFRVGSSLNDITRFSTVDGVPTNEFNYYAVYKREGGASSSSAPSTDWYRHPPADPKPAK